MAFDYYLFNTDWPLANETAGKPVRISCHVIMTLNFHSLIRHLNNILFQLGDNYILLYTKVYYMSFLSNLIGSLLQYYDFILH